MITSYADIPVPQVVTLRHHLNDGTDAERLVQLEEFTLRHDAERQSLPAAGLPGMGHEYANIRVRVDGTEVVYTLQTTITVDPCAAGVCSDPAAHAEGGHDV
jgi:hypothetical protein